MYINTSRVIHIQFINSRSKYTSRSKLYIPREKDHPKDFKLITSIILESENQALSVNFDILKLIVL